MKHVLELGQKREAFHFDLSRYHVAGDPDSGLPILFPRIEGASGPRQLVPYAKWTPMGLWVPPAAMSPVVVANVAYSVTEGVAAGVEGIHVLASAGATALIDFDLGFESQRLEANLGITITDLVLFYAVGVQALTGAPTLAIKSVTMPAIGAAGGAPVLAAIDVGAVLNPVGWPTAVIAGGSVYSVQETLGTPFLQNVDLQKVDVRASFPMANTGTVDLVGCLVHYSNTIASDGH